MPEAVDIRPAAAGDREAVTDLWLRLLDEQAALDDRFGYADDARQRFENDFPVWLRNERWRLFVAEADGRIVGFISAQRWAPPPVYADASEVYLNELYVAPEARRQGTGRRLVEAVRDWAVALRADRLRLGVLAANEQGARFWEAVGARPLSVSYSVELERQPAPEKKSRRIGF